MEPLPKEQTINVTIRTTSPGLGEELEHVVLSEDGFRLRDPNGFKRPDLLICELGRNIDKEFAQIRTMLDTNAVGDVFVISAKTESSLILKAMRAGVKEFISRPMDASELQNALLALKKKIAQALPGNAQKQAPEGRVICIMGAKGGVGTTTLAVNLAMTLADQKNAGSVALVDLNTVFGEIPLFLSLTPVHHWGQIVKNVNRLDSTFLLNVMARHKSGVHVLPSPNHLNNHPPVTSKIIDRLLTTMKKTYDFIILDAGQSLDGPALRIIEMAEKIFLITLLNLPCLHNTNNLLKSLSSIGLEKQDRLKLVVNRFLDKSDITVKEAEENIHREIYWTIPNDYRLTMSAINRGKPLYEISPKAKVTREIVALADTILHGERKVKKAGWFFKKG
jgi:pilus assembly protein CpaE